MKSIIYLTFICCLFYSCKKFNGNREQIQEVLIARDSFIEAFDRFIIDQMDTCHCPGAAITVITDSTTRLLKGYGFRSITDSTMVNTNTVFRLASVSKNIAALLATIMMQENKINFDDKVTEYLPEFRIQPTEYSNAISINHILSQSSGLPYHSYTNLIESGKTLHELIPMFKNVKSSYAPGTEYAYQNASFAMIEPILEKITGQTFEELIRSKLVQPLGLYNMSFCYDSILYNSNHATPHDFHGDCECLVPTELTNKYYNTISAGGINASIADMNKYLYVLLGQRPEIVSSSALSHYFTPQIKTTQDRRYYNYWPGVKDTYYAHGMRVLDYGDHYKYYHGGFANDFRAEIAIDPKNKVAICALFNSTCCLSDFIVPSFIGHYEKWYTKDTTNNSASHQ